MTDDNAVQDELQQAINNITSTDDASSADEANAAVEQIENTIKDGGATDMSEILGAAPAPEMPAMPEVPAPEMPGLTGSNESAPAEDTAPAMEVTQPLNVQPGRAMYGDPDMDRVKISALTDIRPILEKIEGISPERKFMVYKDIIELTDDKSCLESAYNAAAKMSDDKERADALLFIIETVDKLGVKMPVEDK